MALQTIININVDFNDNKYILINAKQYDDCSRWITITCYENGKIFNLSASKHTAYVRYRKADGHGVLNSCRINTRGEVLVELTEQMLAAEGVCYVDLIIVDKGNAVVNIDTGELITIDDSPIMSTMAFCINVYEASVDNSLVESSYEFDALNNALQMANAEYKEVIQLSRSYAIGDANDIRENEDYDNSKYYSKLSKSYAIGDLDGKTNTKDRDNERTDNAEYYSRLAKSYAMGSSDGSTGTRDNETSENAKTYMEKAKVSATNAKTSENNAKASENASALSEANSATSEANAKISEDKAKVSETNAKASEDKARASEEASLLSETNAKTSETKAKTSEQNALTSETNAKSSELSAKGSESNAKASENASLLSEVNASASEINAKASEDKAKISEDNAKASEEICLLSETNAKESEVNASVSENKAKTSETNAKTSEENAKVSETNAKNSETNIVNSANLSQSYAVGGTGTRDDEDTDNAKYYHDRVQSIVDALDDIVVDSEGNGVNLVDLLARINALETKVEAIEKEMANIGSILDEINGETV